MQHNGPDEQIKQFLREVGGVKVGKVRVFNPSLDFKRQEIVEVQVE